MNRPLIAGGGPAGAAAAIALARAGRQPILFERAAGPHDVVCGAFMGWDALAGLARLGVDAAVLGAHRIDRVRLVAGDRVLEARLPHAAAGFSRRTLDAALLKAAGKAGAEIHAGVAIRAAEGRTLRLADGSLVAGEALFLATGKHELRGLARPAATTPSIGFRTAFAPNAALARTLTGTIELHAFDGGYAGLLLQEDGCANLCLSATATRVGPGGIATLLAGLHDAPLLVDRTAHATDWSAIAGVPYGWRATTTGPGIFRLGDQAAVIASLAGDGVAVALASARAATDAYLAGGAGASTRYQQRFSARAKRPLAIAGGIRALAESPRGRRPLAALLTAWPGLAALAARATRIGD